MIRSLPLHGQVCGPFCVSGPAATASHWRAAPHLVNMQLRPKSLASSSSAIMCFTLGRTRPSAQRHTAWRQVPGDGRSPTTTGRTPPGTASAAVGSPRGSLMFFSCNGCAVEAPGRPFKRTAGCSLQEAFPRTSLRLPSVELTSVKKARPACPTGLRSIQSDYGSFAVRSATLRGISEVRMESWVGPAQKGLLYAQRADRRRA